MKFSVQFVSRHGYAVNIVGRDVGLRGLDQAREAAGVPDLDAARVAGTIGYFGIDPECNLSVEQARQAGGYEYTNQRTVHVGNGDLNDFHRVRPVIKRDEETGEVTRVTWEHVIDDDSLIYAWIMDGCPSKWMDSKDDENE